MSAPQQILCPSCRWRPAQSSRWVCAREIGGCGTSWNTFETRGICPKCNWYWEITQCHSCQQFSLHKDWYHDPEESRAPGKVHESELTDL